MWILALAPALSAPELDEPLPPIPVDRTWQVLDGELDPRARLAQAAEKLDAWTIEVAGVEIDGAALQALAETAPDEPILRVVREGLGRPVDLEDFLYLLDDVLVAGDAGRRGEPFFVGAGRARSVGVLIHPDDVFKKRPRVYPRKSTELAVDEPPPQEDFPVAADGEVVSPNWTMRYRTPTDPADMYRTLTEARPDATFPSRIAALVSQLEQQGAEVYLTSFLRYRERGYVMWGAHELRGCSDEACVTATVTRLEAAKAWAPVEITWTHPDGWEATQEAARRTADAFDVVYATEKGARYSKHYDGVAADFVAIGLPRELTLVAPDGTERTFDLTDAEQTRDLSLTPELIDWVEAHFGFSKLRSDYPHWNDKN